MLDLRTGKEMTRRETIKGGLGLAAILAAGKAPAMLLGARLVAFGKEPLPYDEEVEYLESSGHQYIDTLYVPNGSTHWELRCSATYYYPFGQLSSCNRQGRYGNGQRLSILLVNIPGTRHTEIAIGDYYRNTSIAIPVGQINTYYLDVPSCKGTVSGYQFVWSFSPITWTDQESIYLFGRNTENPELGYFRDYSHVVTENGTTIQDFIPVVKDNVGFMYDRVSGRMFGNLGTGTFGYKKKDGTIVNPT